MTIAEIIAIWAPIITVILALSFVFADWPGWRFIETLLIGGGAGHGVVSGLRTIQAQIITPISNGSYIIIPAVIIGVLLYFIHMPQRYRWIQRYGYIWIVGTGLGIVVSTMLQGNILPVIKESISIVGPTPGDYFNQFLSLITFVTVLTYFIFAMEHKGVLGGVARVGRNFLMIAFGLGFSTLLMTYYGVLLERIMWILRALGFTIM